MCCLYLAKILPDAEANSKYPCVEITDVRIPVVFERKRATRSLHDTFSDTANVGVVMAVGL